MKTLFIIFLWLLIPMSFFSTVESSEFIENVFYYNEDTSYKNALKKMKNFAFFSRFPALSPNESSLVKQTISQELQKFGKVTKKPLIAKTPSGEEVDFTDFPNTDASIIYEITQLHDFQGKELPVIKATLKVTSSVELETTHEEMSSVIWTHTYYITGNLAANNEPIVKQMFVLLLADFKNSYKAVNPGAVSKINFYLLS